MIQLISMNHFAGLLKGKLMISFEMGVSPQPIVLFEMSVDQESIEYLAYVKGRCKSWILQKSLIGSCQFRITGVWWNWRASLRWDCWEFYASKGFFSVRKIDIDLPYVRDGFQRLNNSTPKDGEKRVLECSYVSTIGTLNSLACGCITSLVFARQ